MTSDEFLKLITAVNDDTKRAEAIVTLTDTAREIFNELDAAKTALAESQKSRGELQEQCGRLALRIAGQVNNPDPPKEKTEEELKAESVKFFENLGGFE